MHYGFPYRPVTGDDDDGSQCERGRRCEDSSSALRSQGNVCREINKQTQYIELEEEEGRKEGRVSERKEES